MSGEQPVEASDISVVMGTFNGASYINEQLESILRQTVRPREIIICDDGSTDNTVDVVAAITAGADVPVTVHRNSRRLGFAENFLAACDHARGQYIAFSDQDDRWYPQKLEVALGALRTHRAALCVHAVDNIDAAGEFLHYNDQRIARLQVHEPLEPNPWDVYYGFTMLFDRDLLAKIDRSQRGMDDFSPGRTLSHDRWVFFLASCFGRVVTLPDSLAGYRQHASQLFGGPEHRSIPRRILDKLALGGSQVAYQAEVAAHRAAILHSVAAEPDATRAAAGAAQWKHRSSMLSVSAQVRSNGRLERKLALIVGNVRAGAYRSMSRGGLGLQHGLEDLAGLVLPSRLLSAEQRSSNDWEAVVRDTRKDRVT